MLNFIQDNWKWLLGATILVTLVLMVMSASKRKDSDFVDEQSEDEDAGITERPHPNFYKRHGISDNNAA